MFSSTQQRGTKELVAIFGSSRSPRAFSDMLLALLTFSVHGSLHDIEAYGASPNDSSRATIVANQVAFSKALAAAGPG